MAKIKFNQDSQVIITRKVGEFIGGDSIKRIQIKKEIAENPINLGSINKPKNQDIIEIKCKINQKNLLGNIFRGFFG